MRVPRQVPVLISCLLAAGTPVALQAGNPASSVRIKTVAVDPSLSRLTNEELINLLQDEKQQEVIDSPQSSHTSQPALAYGFLPVDAPRPGDENVVRRPQSPVMTELVRRGVAALPTLIRHLGDSRPTGLSVRGVDIGHTGFGDQFDARYPDRQPPGVNTVDNSGENPLPPRATYTLKVGELCYGAIGKIVNRQLSTVGSRVGHTSAVNSPLLYPQLARAVKADWGNLTAEEHAQSLRADILQRNERGYPGPHSWNAIRALLFYYPDTGRETVGQLLRRSLVDSDPVVPLGVHAVAYHEQAQLVAELAPVQWEGLEATLLEIYRTAVEQRPAMVLGRLNRDLLAFTCARRLVGRDHDAEFSEFFSARMTENEIAMAQPENRFMNNSLAHANKSYVPFLKLLSNPARLPR